MEKAREAIRLAVRTDAMIADTVRERMPIQRSIDLMRRGVFRDGSNVLYVHPGSAAALEGHATHQKDG